MSFADSASFSPFCFSSSAFGLPSSRCFFVGVGLLGLDLRHPLGIKRVRPTQELPGSYSKTSGNEWQTLPFPDLITDYISNECHVDKQPLSLQPDRYLL